MWLGPLPVCLAEHHHGKVRRLRLVLATITHLTKAEITSLVEGPYLPGGTVLHDLVHGSQLMLRSSQSGWSSRMGSSQEVGDFSTTALAQGNDAAWEAPYAVNQHQAHVCSAVRRIVPLKHCTGCTSVTRGECSQSLMPLKSDLVLPPKPGLLEHGCYWPRPNQTPEVLSISDRDPDKEEQEVQEGESRTSLAVTERQWLRKTQMKQSQSIVPPPSRPLFRAQSARRKMMRTWQMMQC